MIKVLIIDDEIVIRTGIKTSIDWESLGEVHLKKVLKENLPFMQSRFVNELVKGEYDDTGVILEKSNELGMDLSGTGFQVVIFDIDDFYLITENLSDKEREQFKLSVKNIAEEILSLETKSVVCFSEFDYLISIINIDNINKDRIYDLLKEIQYRVRKHQSLTVTIGTSNICSDVREICKAYNEAVCALRNKVFKGKDKIIRINDVDNSQDYSPIIYPSEDEKEIIHCLKAMDAEKLNQVLEKVYSNFIIVKADMDEIRNVCLRLITISMSQLDEIGVNFRIYKGRNFNPYAEIEKYETLEDIKTWLKDIFTSFIKAMQNSKNEKFKSIVKVAIQYVNSHFHEDIGVDQIAAVTYVTPNYFSRVFKKETGKSFTEWLNAFRVEKARLLLKDLGLKVYEVAEKVGYKD